MQTLTDVDLTTQYITVKICKESTFCAAGMWTGDKQECRVSHCCGRQGAAETMWAHPDPEGGGRRVHNNSIICNYGWMMRPCAPDHM